ncbi:hypothetical protein Bca52824_026836 [Brassica carinata]|uniref:Uncharacterized protein n=1 Tax=Brassica carinata TaxID=52824 RepID=A0A8X7SHA0_BRACI|nr:hypothetical protein Bca52824_026836 [Brassica carinata]
MTGSLKTESRQVSATGQSWSGWYWSVKTIQSGPDRAVELDGLSWSDLDKPVGLVIRAQLVYIETYPTDCGLSDGSRYAYFGSRRLQSVGPCASHGKRLSAGSVQTGVEY